MKKNILTPLVGGLLALIFLVILFLFQVRQTEVAVVTRFGKFEKSIAEPGLNFRLPWPMNKVYKLDNRLRTFERKFEQTTTADGRNLLVSVFIGWKINDPKLFLERFPGGDQGKVEEVLESLVRDTKNGVIGRYAFGDLISTNRADVKLGQMEADMLTAIRPKAQENYGVQVDLVGLKQIGLPRSITEKVFERMRAERQRLVKQFQSEGEAESIRIKAEADQAKQELLAQAEAEATVIKGQAEAEAAKHFAVFQKNPELAVFLLEMKALSAALKDRATLVLDQQTPPFNRLKSYSGDNLELPVQLNKGTGAQKK